MSPLLSDALEQYLAAHSEPAPALLQALERETRADFDDPGMMVGQVEGAFLRMLVRLVGARRVLEIGMFTGYSALSMAEALPADGELITCDIDPKAEAVARKYFAQSPHGKRITIRMGPALQTIATLKGPFDLVFLDADKERYPAYYEAVLPLLRPGGLLVADNTLWSGKVLAPTAETDKAIVAFNERVAKDTRVEKVLLSVRDGMMLARVK